MNQDEFDALYDQYSDLIVVDPSRGGSFDIDDLNRFCKYNRIDCDIISGLKYSETIFCFHSYPDAQRFKNYQSKCQNFYSVNF